MRKSNKRLSIHSFHHRRALTPHMRYSSRSQPTSCLLVTWQSETRESLPPSECRALENDGIDRFLDIVWRCRPEIAGPQAHSNVVSREHRLARQLRFRDPAVSSWDRADDPLRMRTDRKVRTTTLDLITSIMMNPNVDVMSAVTIFEDLRDQCRDAGVPFSELLQVDIEGYDMPPLMIEIIRCDFLCTPELLLFLLDQTASARKFQWFIRRG